MVCAETSKRRARSSTITRPKARAMFRISDWRWVRPVMTAPRAKTHPSWCGGSGVRSTCGRKCGHMHCSKSPPARANPASVDSSHNSDKLALLSAEELKTRPSGGNHARHHAGRARPGFSRQIRSRAGGRRSRRRRGNVRSGLLLARPCCLHLEHQDDGGPRSDPRYARALPFAREAAQLENVTLDKINTSRRRDQNLNLVRNRDRARIWTDPSAELPDLDAADDDGRTQGP